jgi:hypothetical protein
MNGEGRTTRMESSSSRERFEGVWNEMKNEMDIFLEYKV